MILDSFAPTSATRPFCTPPAGVVATALLIRWYDQCQAIVSTSADYTLPLPPQGTQAQPAGAVPVDTRASTAAAVYEIRRRSGLTWDELALLLGVTRQAATDWANGKPVRPANAHKIDRLLAVFRALAATSPAELRAALLAPQPAGGRALDLLRDGDIGAGMAAVRNHAALPLRLPPRAAERPDPEAFLDRLADRPVAITGPLAAKRTRRARASKP